MQFSPKHKKLISILMVVAIMLSTINFNILKNKVVYAETILGVEQPADTSLFWYKAGGTTYQIKLPNGITRNTTVNGKSINFEILRDRHILVFGQPFGDVDSNGEYRYLGYTIDGNKYTNKEFINDADSGRKPYEKKIQPLYIVDERNDKQQNLTLKIETIKEVLAEEGFPSSWQDRDDLLDYFLVQGLKGEGTQASIRMYHKTSNGNIWYQTLTKDYPVEDVKPLVMEVTADFDLNSTVYENQATGFKDKSTATGTEIINWTLKVIDTATSNVVKEFNNKDEAENDLKNGLAQGYYKFELHIDNGEDGTSFREDTAIKYITVNKQEPDSNPIAIIEAPSEVPINQSFTVSAKNSMASYGAKIIKAEFYRDGSLYKTLIDGELELTGESFASKGSHTYYVVITDTKGKSATSNTVTVNITDNRVGSAEAKIDIPDISYEGVYFDVSIRGSRVNVDGENYSLKKAVELDLADYNYDSSVDYYGKLRANGGQIYFEELGEQSLTLEIEPINGTEVSATDYTKVLPTPQAKYNVYGIRKENRKVTIDISNTIVHSQYPLDMDKTKIEIKDPATNQTAIFTTSSANLTTNIKGLKITNDGKLDLLFKKDSNYKVSIYVEDTRGKSSTTDGILKIKNDIAPLAELITSDIHYREDDGIAKIKIKKNGRSLDGDLLTVNNLRYKIDTDNDGNFDDESFINLSNNLLEQEVQLNRDRVGKILLDYTVKEDLTPETIPNFVNSNDYLSHHVTKVIEVDNLAPHTSLNLINNQKVDLLLFGKDEDKNIINDKLSELQTNLNNNDVVVNLISSLEGISFTNNPIKFLSKQDYSNLVYSQTPVHIENGYVGYMTDNDMKVYISDIETGSIKKVLNTNANYKTERYGGRYKLAFNIDFYDDVAYISYQNVTQTETIVYDIKNDIQYTVDKAIKIHDKYSKYGIFKTGYVDHNSTLRTNPDNKLYDVYNKKYIQLANSPIKVTNDAIYYVELSNQLMGSYPNTYYRRTYKLMKYNRVSQAIEMLDSYTIDRATIYSISSETSNGEFYLVTNLDINDTTKRYNILKITDSMKFQNIKTFNHSVVTEDVIYTAIFGNSLIIRDNTSYYKIENNNLTIYDFDDSLYSTSLIDNIFNIYIDDNGYIYEVTTYYWQYNYVVRRLDSNFNINWEYQINYDFFPIGAGASASFFAKLDKYNNYNYKKLRFFSYEDDWIYSWSSNGMSTGSGGVYTFDYIGNFSLDTDGNERGTFIDSKGDMYLVVVPTSGFNETRIITSDIRIYNYKTLEKYRINDFNGFSSNVSFQKAVRFFKDDKFWIFGDVGFGYLDFKDFSTTFSDELVLDGQGTGSLFEYLDNCYIDDKSKYVAAFDRSDDKYYVYEFPASFKENLINKINNYTPNNNSLKYITIIIDEFLSLSDKDINEIVNVIKSKGLKTIWIGNSNNETTGRAIVNKTGGKYYNHSNYNEAFNKIETYIESQLPNKEELYTNKVKIGEPISFDKFYFDLENDNYDASSIRWYFRQTYAPNGYSVNANKWLTNPISSFDKPGTYYVSWDTKDIPKPSDTDSRFNNYRKNAIRNELRIDVGTTEPPKVDIAPTININISGDLRENHRVDFMIDIQRGTKEFNMSSLDISFNTTDYLPYVKPTETEFSRVFSNTGSKTITVNIRATDGTLYTETKTFNIDIDNTPNADFSISGTGQRDEEGYATFKITDNSGPTDDDIGTAKYYYEDTAYVENADGSFSPSGTKYYELEPNEAGEFEISKLGTTNIKQVVEDYYYNGIGLDGYDLDQYRVFKTAEKITTINVINEAPTLEYEVLANVIVKGQSIEHIIDVTDDTIAGDEVEYRFIHYDTYYKNSDGKHSNSGIITSEPLETTNLKGKYVFEARVKDEDVAYSDWVNGGTVYVVSEPIADFELSGAGEVQDNVFQSGSQIIFNNLARNEDYGLTLQNHGIKYMKIEYRNVTNNNWNTVFELDNMPDYFFNINMPVIDDIGIYEVRQTIMSVDGIEATATKAFTVMDLRIDAEIQPNTIYASQSYKIKAVVSKDSQGVVAKNHKGEWITLDKVNEDADNYYYEKEITTLETLADGPYNIEIYGLYPYNNEIRQDITLTVNTPVTVDLTLSPNTQAASETISIKAETDSKVESSEVVVTVEGETPFNLINDGKIGDISSWVNDFNIPSTKPDGIYNVEVIATLPNGNTATDNKTLTISTPINLTPLMPAEISTNSICNIGATTSKYVNSLTVTLYKGKSFETTLNLIGTINGSNKNWTKSYNVSETIPEGTYIAEFRARTPNGNIETKTVNFRVNTLKIYGSLLPTDPMAGDELIFNITTEGYAEKLELILEDDIINNDEREDMGYDSVEYPVIIDLDETQNVVTTEFKYIVWCTTPQSLTLKGERLRPPYIFKVRAWKGSVYKDVEFVTEIQGDIRQLIKVGIVGNEQN
ncbi:MAG: hypothetical protein PWQ37_2699 [Candidatus Petromonas sp.]|jgi:hypothetical protein|nr:hypothetical protein [Candidatus Petromonas sp.]